VLPDIPTLSEFVRGYDATTWWGIAAPKNTPTEILQKLNTEINASLASPALKARIAELGDIAFASSREQFARVVVEDTEKWAKVIREAGIKAESTEPHISRDRRGLAGAPWGPPCGSPIARVQLPILSCDVLPAREGIGCISVSGNGARS